jgi:polar amino acid transport system substrate-binding protein
MYVGNTKQPTGYDYDLGQALGKVLGVKFQFMNAPFATIVMSVRTGKYDLFMTDMLDTAAREKVLDFVDYSYGAQSLMVLKGNPNGISNIDSLQGKTVACEIGTSAQLLLQQLNAQYKSAGKPQVAVLTFPTEAAALLALKANRVVAIMGGNSTNAYAAQTTNNGATFENLVDPAAPKGYEPQLVGIGISKTTPQLTTAVQKALQHLIDNGEYKTITDRYDLIPVDAAQINGASQVTPSASPTL